jgi:hypothetical protein
MIAWFSKHAELVVVVLLGLVSVSTAYTSFQASLYDSQMAGAYATGGTYKTEAESLYLESNQQYVQDAQTLTALDALNVEIYNTSGDQAALAQAKYDSVWSSSVSSVLMEAIDRASAETDATGTYTNPQDDEAYLDDLFGAYDATNAESRAQLALGDDYNARGDKLTLNTVLMALSLFLLGVAAVVKVNQTRILLCVMAMVIFTVAAALTATIPVVGVG